MKQLLSILIPVLLMLAVALNQSLPSYAARKEAKKKGVSQEVIDDITKKVDRLTEKLYERELYTPEDSRQLIALKLQLDEQMDVMSEASFAPLYYKIANIYRARGKEKEAIICYQTILENFSETAYGAKSRDNLTEMGVEIKLPETKSADEDEEEF